MDEVGGDRRAIGGLLGHWSVWTRRAVGLLEECQRGPGRPASQGRANHRLKADFFDAANQFKGCIAGTWRLVLGETLSPGQAEEINRVYRSYPELNDDVFVAAGRDAWLSG